MNSQQSQNSLDSLDQIIDHIFTNGIKQPHHYQIEFDTETLNHNEQTQYIFNQLSAILQKSFHYLFPQVFQDGLQYIGRLKGTDFTILNSYFKSFGFMIHCKISLPSSNNQETTITMNNNQIKTNVLPIHSIINEEYVHSLINNCNDSNTIDEYAEAEDDDLPLPDLPNNDFMEVEKLELKDYKKHMIDPVTKSVYELSFDFF